MSEPNIDTETATSWRMFAGRADDGSFRHTSNHPRTVEAYGHSEVVDVEVTETADGSYWGWIGAERDYPAMIWHRLSLFRMCFPYGPEAEEAKGRGRVVRLTITEAAS
jgi:hypothetical protein